MDRNLSGWTLYRLKKGLSDESNSVCVSFNLVVMLGDAASLWKTARAAVGKVQDSVSNALENIAGDDDEFGAEELESYKEQLAEAQMYM